MRMRLRVRLGCDAPDPQPHPGPSKGRMVTRRVTGSYLPVTRSCGVAASEPHLTQSWDKVGMLISGFIWTFSTFVPKVAVFIE